MSDAALNFRCAVLVPCRNEELVVERKLRNLARLSWPAGQTAPRVIFVDDFSTDRTAERIATWIADNPAVGVTLELLRNDVRPGKNGAIECGLAQLGEGLDVVVLTDADVLVEQNALVEVSRAFLQNEQLGMACATQVFVADLPESGDGAQAARMQPVGEPWDRVTRAVRRFESRFGRLFSVHGQWLAWRVELGLQPAVGVAADDVDLMIQARSSARPQVRMLPGVRFYEGKPQAGEGLDSQALRRARAWFQVFERPAVLARWRGLDAWQGRAYRFLPGAAPALAVSLACAGLLVAFVLGGGPGLGWALFILIGVLLSPPGRSWWRTLCLIHQAKRLERKNPMAEAWEMSRE